jgi:hypothetical protein
LFTGHPIQLQSLLGPNPPLHLLLSSMAFFGLFPAPVATKEAGDVATDGRTRNAQLLRDAGLVAVAEAELVE